MINSECIMEVYNLVDSTRAYHNLNNYNWR
jgi:hypothetical protein